MRHGLKDQLAVGAGPPGTANAQAEADPRDPAPGAEDPLVGRQAGRFRLVRRLGVGGMGTVYLGVHEAIGSKVAVKVLHEHLSVRDEQVARFYAEARVVNLIGHESIVNIFDTSVLPPRRHYLVMEYLEGKTLDSLLGDALPPARVVSILAQVCDALQAAHASGVVHRDLKPDNIFLVRRGRDLDCVKVLDFGAAKLFGDGQPSENMQVSTFIGTPAFMSPEQCAGEAVDGRADLYALGLIAYQMLTGMPPFRIQGLAGFVRAHMELIPSPPHEVNAQVSPALSQVIMKALEKRREERFRDATAMREALEQALKAPAAAIPLPAPRQPAGGGPPQAAPAARAQQEGKSPGQLVARVTTETGAVLSNLPCVDLTRGGVFICTQQVLPPLLSRVQLVLRFGSRELACSAEVVRHVMEEQARAWGMAPGFAVQFKDVREEVRAAMACLARGEALTPHPGSPVQVADDAHAARLLAPFNSCRDDALYEALGLAQYATFDEVRLRVREVRRTLDEVAARQLSANQRRQLEVARALMERASAVLGNALRRAEYDARRGNYAGVARCISQGVTASQLEVLRTRFLAMNPGAEAAGLIHRTTAEAWLNQDRHSEALEEYERALGADPLNLGLQQVYWKLRQPRPSLPTL